MCFTITAVRQRNKESATVTRKASHDISSLRLQETETKRQRILWSHKTFVANQLKLGLFYDTNTPRLIVAATCCGGGGHRSTAGYEGWWGSEEQSKNTEEQENQPKHEATETALERSCCSRSLCNLTEPEPFCRNKCQKTVINAASGASTFNWWIHKCKQLSCA